MHQELATGGGGGGGGGGDRIDDEDDRWVLKDTLEVWVRAKKIMLLWVLHSISFDGLHSWYVNQDVSLGGKKVVEPFACTAGALLVITV